MAMFRNIAGRCSVAVAPRTYGSESPTGTGMSFQRVLSRYIILEWGAYFIFCKMSGPSEALYELYEIIRSINDITNLRSYYCQLDAPGMKLCTLGPFNPITHNAPRT